MAGTLAGMFGGKLPTTTAAGTSSTTGKKKGKDSRPAALVPWVEKYRPKVVDDVAYQEEVVSALKKSLETGQLPHLLFYGPPGTGKTSTILAIAHQLFGPELYKSRVMELNASDERGIDVIRSKVKTFAQVAVGAPLNKPGSQAYPNPPFKLIILDEADSMTADAQAALRRTMETYTKVTRFCLICNYISRIIEPLASRCAKFRFKPLEAGTMKTRLEFICRQESLNLNPELLDNLIKLSDGDMRKAITYIQSASRLYGGTINADSVFEISGQVPANIVTNMIKIAKTNSFERLQGWIDDVVASGYSAAQVLYQLHDVVVEDASLNNKQKAKIEEAIAKSDGCLVDGADEYLQLMQVAAVVMRILCS